jgi:hypothetical protein
MQGIGHEQIKGDKNRVLCREPPSAFNEVLRQKTSQIGASYLRYFTKISAVF